MAEIRIENLHKAFGEFVAADFNATINSASANHADIVLAPFPDPMAVKGGVYMQLYWHKMAPN